MRHCVIRSEPRACTARSRWGSAVLQAFLEMFFDRVRMQLEVKVCRAYGARAMLGNRCPSPYRAGLTFGGRPSGPQSPDCLLEKHFQDGLVERQIPSDALKAGSQLCPDDKEEGGSQLHVPSIGNECPESYSCGIFAVRYLQAASPAGAGRGVMSADSRPMAHLIASVYICCSRGSSQFSFGCPRVE